MSTPFRQLTTTWRDHFSPPPQPTAIARVTFTDPYMDVHLTDGRILRVPLSWFPVLQKASRADREQVEIDSDGESLHWEHLDEDIHIETLLKSYSGS